MARCYVHPTLDSMCTTDEGENGPGITTIQPIPVCCLHCAVMCVGVFKYVIILFLLYLFITCPIAMETSGVFRPRCLCNTGLPNQRYIQQAQLKGMPAPKRFCCGAEGLCSISPGLCWSRFRCSVVICSVVI